LLLYDPVGRLTMAVSSSGSAGSETYAYNSGTNRLASVTETNGTRTVSYDGRGNTVTETRPGGLAVAASYDGHARLESYDRSNIGAQTYSYNGLGDRVRVVKPTGTRHFVYDSQGRVVAEYGASASDVKAEFIWALPPAANDNSPFGGADGIVGYAPLALVTTNTSSQLTLYWVHGNHLGVPIVTTNALGQVVDPGSDFLRPGFPGQSQVLSDLYYNRARDYDPVLGRYIQADPIGLLGGANPYLYANADPLNIIDPRGLNPSTAEVADVALDWWLKRQARPSRATPWGRIWSVGEAIGGAAAVALFIYKQQCEEDDPNGCNEQRRWEEQRCKSKFGVIKWQYSACMDRAERNWDLCNRGLPELGPWTDKDNDGWQPSTPPRKKM
jgi:RHS repeat-associated protein